MKAPISICRSSSGNPRDYSGRIVDYAPIR
jgi:hypothetical protein